MHYPGGKNAPGTFHKIINLLPPHHVYIEPFAGSGAILRMKRPARLNIAIDKNWQTIHALAAELAATIPTTTAAPATIHTTADDIPYPPWPTFGPPEFHLAPGDALDWLNGHLFDRNTLIYCDPPYLLTAPGHRTRYACPITQDEHKHLLEILRACPAMVILSGYENLFYKTDLSDWNHTTFQAILHTGEMATEHLWYNFPEPLALHDYRYLGNTFRQREKIRRQQRRWTRRLRALPTLQRNALLATLVEACEIPTP